MLNIWIIQIGEPLIINGHERKMRSNILAEELAKRGHRVTLWVSAFDHDKKKWAIKTEDDLLGRDRIHTVVIRGIGYKNNISLARVLDHRILSWKFKRLSQQEVQPDIIIASLPPHDLAYQSFKFANTRGIPIIVDIRDKWPEIFLNAFPAWLRRAGKTLLFREFQMLKKTMKYSDCIVAVSNTFLEWGLSYGKRDRSKYDEVIYLGYHKPRVGNAPMKLSNDLMNALEAVKGKTVVTYIGTFSGNQNPSIILECAKEMGKDDIAFIFTGYGYLYDKMKESKGQQDNVFFVGWLNENEIDTLLLNSSIGICPYSIKSDIFPNKAFMYLSAGLPIISSYQGDLKQLIKAENIGCYFDPGDIDSMRSSVLQLHEDKNLYKEMSNNALRIFESRFNEPRIYNGYANNIECLAKKATSYG